MFDALNKLVRFRHFFYTQQSALPSNIEYPPSWEIVNLNQMATNVLLRFEKKRQIIFFHGLKKTLFFIISLK